MTRTERSSTGSVVKWLTGFGTSLLGDQIYFLALSWAAVQVAEPSVVGLILAAGSIPRLVMLLVGGALADRINPKRLIMLSDTGRTLAMVLFAVLLTFASAGPVTLAVLAVVFGILDGFFLPAVGALPPRIASLDQMARIQALRTTIQRIVVFAGAPLAGWIVAMRGLADAFWVCAILFAVSVGFLAMITLRPKEAVAAEQEREAAESAHSETVAEPADQDANTSVIKDIAAGLGFIRRHPVLPFLLTIVFVGEIGFSGPMSAGLPILARQDDWGPTGVGYLLGGFGLGAAASAIVLAMAKRIPRGGVVAYTALAVMGVSVTLIGFAQGVWVAVGLACLLGLGAGIYGTIINALLLTSTPTSELGRVMSVLSLASYGSVPISYALTGILADALRAETPFIIGGLVVLLAAVAALLHPRLRALRLAEKDDQPDEPDETDGRPGSEESGATDEVRNSNYQPRRAARS